MHAEGFAAGELKHGPIALIEDGLPVIVVMPSPKNADHAALQAAVQHPRDPGPRRAHHRHRRGGRRHGAGPTPITCSRSRGVNAFPAAAVHHSAAGVRRRRRPGPRLRRRQAAQPGQVRHRRVAPSTSPSRRSTSRRGGAAGNSVAFVSEDAFAHFLAAYRAGMAQLPPVDARSMCRRRWAPCARTGSTGRRPARAAAAGPQRVHPDVPDNLPHSAAAHRVQHRPAGRGRNVRAGQADSGRRR